MTFTVLNWNINSIRKRFADLQQYALFNNIDVLCIQETCADNSFNPRFGGYVRYTLEHDQENRGLAIYVKNDIPVKRIPVDFGYNTESLCVKVYLNGYQLNVVNVYIPDGQLNTQLFPQFVTSEPTLLVGDLNARHSKLGSEGNTINSNGRR